MRLSFLGRVHEGKFKPDDSVRFAAQLARLEGKRVRLALQREPQKRSLNQNSYYWGVVVATIGEWSGHEPNEIHEAMKSMFLPVKRVKLGREVVEIPPSTAALQIEEFSGYVSQVMRWAAEQGLYIPSSEEFV